ncbi:MAG: beta-lactamase family protein [Rudaea sp.]|uniref:serine hydrolase domain-containing protein n=1 Tax=unclassified Rudaea TaxID=2627037 RepID=UPI0010F99F32|nr:MULTISPECIES: serine hydrolase domain-containing protein [unclassified Rudaea]MBN8887692.1 beta-lactamase family protein [Rudaea sp.]MBR0347755.1 beta-lactamase family protein [Rudaea sp.]
MKKAKWLLAVSAALTTLFAAAQAPTETSPPAAAATAPPVADSVPGLTKTDVDAWLDGYMPYALATGDIAGAVVAVVKDGQIVTSRGYGYADVDARKPVDPKLTLFRPGSVSKLFTWTAVMQQVEQGKIDLDGDVNKYLDFQIPARDGKPLTMRQIMQHVGGFEEQGKEIMTYGPNPPKFDDLLKRWTPERVFEPGTTPAYSNYATSLAGYIVQRVSGESFDDYLDKHLFAPLDMKHSTFRQPLPAALAPLMSKGYRRASEPPIEFENVGPAPAGSLASPGEDMAHFMIAHLNGGEYNGNRILRADTIEKMHNSPLTLLPPLNRMELGFFETNLNGRQVIAHLGDTQVFHTSLHLFLKDNVGFYVSFNSAGKEGAVGPLRGALFQDFADRYLPNVAPPDGKVDEKTAKEHAQLMAGKWTVSRGSRSNFLAITDFIGQNTLSVDEKGNLVTPFKTLGGAPRQWVEIAPFVWRDKNSHDRFAAKVVDGKPVRWSFDTISPFMVFDRPEWYRDSGWLMPLFSLGLGALLLTGLFWPITAIVRRRYGAKLALDAKSLNVYRWSRIAAIAVVAAIAIWAFTVTTMMKDLSNFSSRFDGVLWFAEIFGTVAFIGGFLVMLWNLATVWRGDPRWPAKTWSIVLALSAFFVLWVALAFKLIHFGTNF